MTKEDALFFLGRFRTEGINEKLYDALGVAIEALNAQTDKRTETHACDLISRQAAIDAVLKRDSNCGIDAAETLKALPSAQQERKKGHWIEINDSYNRISGKCSVCGWESHMYEDDVVGMDFCPNCGARLDGEQHD